MDFAHQLVQQLINGVSLGSIYALIALGYTMIRRVYRLRGSHNRALIDFPRAPHFNGDNGGARHVGRENRL